MATTFNGRLLENDWEKFNWNNNSEGLRSRVAYEVDEGQTWGSVDVLYSVKFDVGPTLYTVECEPCARQLTVWMPGTDGQTDRRQSPPQSLESPFNWSQ